ncbi:MAG: hypothetical protein RLZ71_1081 [Actinomycetota bacterium]|jgi:cell division protein FtsW
MSKKTRVSRRLDIGGATNASVSFLKSSFTGQSTNFTMLLSIVTLLVGFGLFMVLSSSSIDAVKSGGGGFSIFLKQILAVVLGASIMGAVSRVRSETMYRFTPHLMAIALFLQLMVFSPLGTEINGNRNWISLPGFSLQPSEFLKLAMVFAIAKSLTTLSSELTYDWKAWVKVALLPVVSMVLVLFGSDLGTVIIMAAILLGMASLAGLPRNFFTITVAIAAFGVFLAVVRSASRLGRIMAWWNPDAPDPNQYNWQSEHATWAFASGGLRGVGLGQSKLKWSWIPEAENDFIFAIIGEEGGFFVAVGVILVFVILTYTMMKTATRAKSDFASLVVKGIMVWIGVQAVVNIAVVLGLLPVLGVPLPLVSAGGTSMLFLLGAVGVVLAIEREAEFKPVVRRR